jgi:hypothetical protein
MPMVDQRAEHIVSFDGFRNYFNKETRDEGG